MLGDEYAQILTVRGHLQSLCMHRRFRTFPQL